jgi:hypothetical protein
MPGAHVTLDALRDFRIAMIKFIETVAMGLSDADSDILRTANWLDLEQIPYWTVQIRKRQELVTRCQDAVRQKLLYKDSTGGRQSAIDEQKALKKAERLLLEAQEKLVASRQYYRRIQKAHLEYRGQVAKLNLSLTGTLAECVAKLQSLQNTVAQYAAIEVPTEQGSMAQSADRIESQTNSPVEPSPKPEAGA